LRICKMGLLVEVQDTAPCSPCHKIGHRRRTAVFRPRRVGCGGAFRPARKGKLPLRSAGRPRTPPASQVLGEEEEDDLSTVEGAPSSPSSGPSSPSGSCSTSSTDSGDSTADDDDCDSGDLLSEEDEAVESSAKEEELLEALPVAEDGLPGESSTQTAELAEVHELSGCRPTPESSRLRRVRFDDEAVAWHAIRPYCEVYGLHPREFDFGRNYSMVPAGGFPNVSTSRDSECDDGDESDSDSDEGDWEAWEPSKDPVMEPGAVLVIE
ncbi:unnamed protein product, partial [Polarella glacialis]